MRHIPGLHGWQFHAEATSDAAPAAKRLPVMLTNALGGEENGRE